MSGRHSTLWQPTRQLVILVGGNGTRLGALAKNVPKPLMQIDEKSVFVDHVIFNFARQGFTDVLLLAGHAAEQVVERYDGNRVCGATIRVIKESEPAGTAGAILNAKDFLQDTFILANGDTLFDINIRHLDRALAENPAATGVMALRGVGDAGRYGTVEIQDGHVTAFREKDPTSPQGGLINAGVGLFRKSLLSYISKSPCSMEVDVYPQMVADQQLLGCEFAGYFIDIGLPETLEQARADIPARWRRPALFLDRDGVINEDKGYTHRVDDLKFVDGAIDMIRQVNDAGALVIVVTNQAGVAHGYYEWSDVDTFHDAITDALNKNGAFVDAFYSCPFHPAATVSAYLHPDHPNRKPNPGMINQALRDWPILPERSVLIGDKESDVIAAQRAGIEGLLFEGTDLTALKDLVFRRIDRHQNSWISEP